MLSRAITLTRESERWSGLSAIGANLTQTPVSADTFSAEWDRQRFGGEAAITGHGKPSSNAAVHWQWWPDPIEVPTGGGCPTQVGQSEWCRPAGQISRQRFLLPSVTTVFAMCVNSLRNSSAGRSPKLGSSFSENACATSSQSEAIKYSRASGKTVRSSNPI